MRTLTFLCFLILPALCFAQARQFQGDWYGVGDVMGQKLRITLHFKASGDSLMGTMDSPDQKVTGMMVTRSSVDGNALSFEVGSIGLTFNGMLEGQEIFGNANQAGLVIPVEFGREELQAPVTSRRQDPKNYPYHREEVTFINAVEGHKLAGTFTRPQSEGSYPAAVLISGSGPQNRNSELMNHRPFLVIADFLARNGWAVLRYDDRGVEESEGTFSGTTVDELAEDALAAFEYLKTRDDVDAGKIGLIGHSEGGLIAPSLAANHEDIAFIVALAGPGTPGMQVIMDQTELILSRSGYSSRDIAVIKDGQQEVLEIVRSFPDTLGLTAALRPVLDSIVFSMPEEEVEFFGGYEELVDIRLQEFTDPWYQSFVHSDPRPFYEKVQCPVLALNGEKDLQVPWEANLDGIRRALAKGGNLDVEVRSFPELNHLFQHSETGLPDEYGKIEETFAPKVLLTMMAWLNGLD